MISTYSLQFIGARFEHMTLKYKQTFEVLWKIYKDGTLHKIVEDSADCEKNKFLKFSNLTSSYVYEFEEVLEREGLRKDYQSIDDDDGGIIANFIMKKFDLPIGSRGNARLQYIEIYISKYFRDVVR